ncbi:TPA: hypothetical protein ACXNHW_004804 [Pseudomonas aeruginosa]
MKQTFEYHIENIDIPYQDLPQSVRLLGRQRRTDKALEPDPMRWAILFAGSKCSASARKVGSW